jgi:PAS domain S-box-containing protein
MAPVQSEQHRKTDGALKDNERFLEEIIDGIQDGISVLDRELNVIHVNKTMEKWFARAMPLAGKKCYRAYHGCDTPCNNCPTIKAIETGLPQTGHMPYQENSAPGKLLELSALPLVDEDGKITGVIEYVHDISEQRKAEEMNKARTDFLSKLVGLTDAVELAELTFDHITKQMPADAGLIILRSGLIAGKDYEVVYSFDTDEDGTLAISTERKFFNLEEDSFTAKVLRSGQMYVIHRSEEDCKNWTSKPGHVTTFNERPSRSLAYLPLAIHGQTFGVLTVQSYEPDAYDKVRLSFLESVAADLALAITAVKMTEAFKDGEERYRIVAEQTGQMIYDYDVASGAITWSGAIEAITGYSLQEFQSVDINAWSNLIHPDDRPNALALLDEAMRNCGRYNVEYRMKSRDGRHVWVEDNGIFLQDRSGRAFRMLGTMSDITEHRHARELLVQSEEKYRNLIETMPNGLIIADTRGVAIFANPAAARIMGYAYKELIGLNLAQCLPEESLPVLREQLEKRWHGEHSEYELVIKRKDGELRTILVNAAPLLGENSGIVGTSAIFSDITETKTAETEKLELREKLARAQRMESLGVLAGGVAHDLNNILGPLVAYPELIRMELPQDSPIANRISKMETSAHRAAEVVQDLLTMARRGRYEMTILRLNGIIESYLESPEFRELCSRQPSVTLKCVFDSNSMPIYGSSSHLHKAVMNLVLNAFDAMRQGGELILKTETRYVEKLDGGYDNIERGMYTILSVSDNGVGIDQKDLKRLFEPFYTKKVMGKSGSGLGLPIVYGVVKDHNGYIDVRSEPNMGSEFILYFPATTKLAESTCGAVTDIRGNEKILIVDDVLEQRELAATVLRSLGYKVHIAAGGREAVEFLKKNSVDVVVLDMIMESDFDGLDTFREIIKIHPGQKAIITSGFSETDRVKEAERLGVGKYIRKPYTMQKLGMAIRELVGSQSLIPA